MGRQGGKTLQGCREGCGGRQRSFPRCPSQFLKKSVTQKSRKQRIWEQESTQGRSTDGPRIERLPGGRTREVEPRSGNGEVGKPHADLGTHSPGIF